MTKQRANLGFDILPQSEAPSPGGFDPAEWEIGTPPRPRPDADSARKAAEATGFHSRQAAPVTAPAAGQGGHASPPQADTTAAPVRRRRTGRNAQFNLKARPDTIQSFCAVADAKGWGLGETLEHAVALLQREYGQESLK